MNFNIWFWILNFIIVFEFLTIYLKCSKGLLWFIIIRPLLFYFKSRDFRVLFFVFDAFAFFIFGFLLNLIIFFVERNHHRSRSFYSNFKFFTLIIFIFKLSLHFGNCATILVSVNLLNFIIKSLLLVQVSDLVFISLVLKILCPIFFGQELLPKFSNFLHNIQGTKLWVLFYYWWSSFLHKYHVGRQTLLWFFEIRWKSLKLPYLFFISFFVFSSIFFVR